MKKNLFFVLFLSLSFCFAQNINKNLGDFNQLKVYDGLSVRLIESNENKAVISGKYADKVVTVVKNDLLKIKLNIEKYHAGKDVHVDLYYKKIYLIDANEGAFIKSEGTISSIDLDVNAQEGAEIDIAVKTKRLNVRSISGANISISGTTNNQEVTANTGANYNGKALKSNQTGASVSSGATVKIYAKEVAKATAKAGGTIRVYGNPEMIDQKKILGGSITIVD